MKLFLLFFLIISLVGCQQQVTPQPVPEVEPIVDNTETIVEPTVEPSIPPDINGFIVGSLSYPSEGIPKDLKVCAVNVITNTETCTSDHRVDIEGTKGAGYQIEVPPGDYQVYAQVASNPTQKAYYSEFVTCGLQYGCPSHEPITVSVEPGTTVSQIDPADWYAGN